MLFRSPLAAVSVGCGTVVYYMLTNISDNTTIISSMGADEATAKLRLVIDSVLGNRAMIVMIAAFAITIMVVYLVRRMSIDYSWSIAMIAGVIIDLVVLLVGDLIYDTQLSLGMAVLGSIVALVIAKILEFFRFCVDYSRTEKVQYEDDEYYYYVKAVPKMSMSAASKTVKRINTQRRPVRALEEEDDDMTIAPPRRVNRSVVTERTGGRNGHTRPSQGRAGGRSVTISRDLDEGAADDYEEI